MSYKLSEFITALNVALNYPAITYDDVSVYADMCIGEINTTLHTGLRTLREYLKLSRDARISAGAPISLSNEPTGTYASIPIKSTKMSVGSGWCYYVGTDKPEWTKKYIHSNGGSGGVDKVRDFLYGAYTSDGAVSFYEAYAYSDSLCLWVKTQAFDDVDMSEFLPEEWILLFMLPYVCFKYTARDGGTSGTFAEEMEQGFQQLQDSYDVPPFVNLSNHRNDPAYAKDVSDALAAGSDLNVACVTRAIGEEMKHPRNVLATYGSMYDAGGWGV